MIPSIQKLIVLAVILWLVWTIFKLFERRSKNLNSEKVNYNQKMKCANCGAWIEKENCTNPDCLINN